MKKAFLYSLVLHLLLFVLILNIQKTLKTKVISEESMSILIVSPKSPEIKKPESELKPKKLEKMPNLKSKKEPKHLSSIPDGEKEIISRESKQKNEVKSENDNIREKLAQLTPQQNQKKPSDLFDKEIIGKLSKKELNRTEKFESSKGISFSTKEFSDWGYLQRLKEKIERVWQYPPQAAEKGIYGDLYIKFIIDKTGKLASVELIRTSGYRLLDDAALKALRDAQPFWPLPEDFQKDSLTITGHFIYILHGLYLR